MIGYAPIEKAQATFQAEISSPIWFINIKDRLRIAGEIEWWIGLQPRKRTWYSRTRLTLPQIFWEVACWIFNWIRMDMCSWRWNAQNARWTKHTEEEGTFPQNNRFIWTTTITTWITRHRFVGRRSGETQSNGRSGLVILAHNITPFTVNRTFTPFRDVKLLRCKTN